MSSITFEYNTSVFATVVRSIAAPFAALTETVSGYVARRNAERRLEALDDRLLSDIGINRAEIHDIVWNHKAV